MPTLRALLDVLGPAVSALAGEAGLDAEVSEVVLVGPGDLVPDNPGALLICLERVGLLERGLKAAGVVVKLHGSDPAPWAGAALPVIADDDLLPWNHLLQLLSMATCASGSSGGMGDLFALANSVAAMVGGAVAIEDPQGRVLANSSLPGQPIDAARQQGILGRQVPDLSNNDRIYGEMHRAAGGVRVPAEGDVLPRLAVAVRSGAELLGSLWVVEGTPLPKESEQALFDAGRLPGCPAPAAGTGRQRCGATGLRRAAAWPARRTLRAGTGGRAARPRSDRPVAVLGFSLLDRTASDELDADAVADLVQLQCAAFRSRSSVLVQLGTVYALVPSGDLSRARLVQLAAAVVERARAALRVELGGAVGATVGSLYEVARSRGDVDAVLRLGTAGTVAAVEDVLPQVALLDLQAHLAGTPHLRLPAVHRMLTHDEQGTPYGESVLAYLAANADVPAAATSVNVHPNTFRYRLRRVKELFDLDLEDPDVRLIVWLQLRTRR